MVASTDQVGSHAENIVIKEQWYNLNTYKDEIRKYIRDQKVNLGQHSDMLLNYNILYRSIFAGAKVSDKKERFPFAKEMFNTLKALLIEACVPGYSALFDDDGQNAQSILLAPHLKSVMTNQFRNIALIEKITDKGFFDWLLKGEIVAFVKLKQITERYRKKEELTDALTGEKVLQFKIETGVTYEDLDIEFIDPLDFYVDAVDYEKDPKGCPKLIRSFITPRELLCDKTNYTLLSEEDKQTIINRFTNRLGTEYYSGSTRGEETYSDSANAQIEVYTFRGDYVTTDGKLLTNIKAVMVEDFIGSLEYSGVDTNQLVYAPYVIDRDTHRGVSPLCSTIPINRLANKCTDLFIKNLDEVCNPIIMYQTGSLPVGENKTFRAKRELQWNGLNADPPSFFTPPEISPNGVNLLQMIVEQSKEMMGVNKYMSGDMTGSVRTAQESQILFEKANARMRVETDTFSYKFLLPLVTTFYAFNRELAMAAEHPLDPIYANPELKVTFTTGAGKADKEGELNRLMQLLQLPIAQMIFSNLNPNQVLIAVRYLMAKAGLKDQDNILQLTEDGEPTYITGVDENGKDIPEEPINQPQGEGDITLEDDEIVMPGVQNEQGGMTYGL